MVALEVQSAEFVDLVVSLYSDRTNKEPVITVILELQSEWIVCGAVFIRAEVNRSVLG